MTQLAEIQQIVNEQQNQLSVLLPVTAVEYLLDQKNDADRLREEKRMLQSKLNYYKNMHPATVKEAQLLRKEINRMRKENSRGTLVFLPEE